MKVKVRWSSSALSLSEHFQIYSSISGILTPYVYIHCWLSNIMFLDICIMLAFNPQQEVLKENGWLTSPFHHIWCIYSHFTPIVIRWVRLDKRRSLPVLQLWRNRIIHQIFLSLYAHSLSVPFYLRWRMLVISLMLSKGFLEAISTGW